MPYLSVMNKEATCKWNKWHIPVLVVLLVMVACDKENHRIKKYTKNLDGERIWSGVWESSTPAYDSNGQSGYENKKVTITDTLINIDVVDGTTLKFGDKELRYDENNSVANTVLYTNNESQTERLLYFTGRDSMSYINYIGKYTRLELHTQ